MEASSSFPSIFVTVGTTNFDRLIKEIDTEAFLERIRELGCTQLTLQIGNGEYEPAFLPTCEELSFVFYKYKRSLGEDMEAADLIISHAGAGSILEGLALHKPLVVVTNDSLMDNHQAELASALSATGFLFATTPSSLLQDLQTFDFTQIAPFPPPNEAAFPSLIDSMLGLDAPRKV